MELPPELLRSIEAARARAELRARGIDPDPAWQADEPIDQALLDEYKLSARLSVIGRIDSISEFYESHLRRTRLARWRRTPIHNGD